MIERPRAVLSEIFAAPPCAFEPYGHSTCHPDQKSPKIQSNAEMGFVPRIATTYCAGPFSRRATYTTASSKVENAVRYATGPQATSYRGLPGDKVSNPRASACRMRATC